ncbi:uncharacterized protein [Diadema setosum]|uniref:uncharacterized protein n=1 Tax=Diadema setosum TaxID=31175 RepID=UPI003B3B8863
MTANHKIQPYGVHVPFRLPQRLYDAAKKGDILELKNLLKGLAMDDARRLMEHDSIITEPILNIAVRFKHEHLVRVLVEFYGVSVDGKDKVGNGVLAEDSIDETTPLMQSVLGGNVNILRIICKKIRDANKGFPLHRVCGGDTPNGVQVAKILLHSGADVNLKNAKGMTPLMLACQRRATEMVKMLLQHGAETNLCSPDGNTALHYAIKRPDEITNESIWNRSQIHKLLMKHGAVTKKNSLGLTPLFLACIKGNTGMVNFILTYSSASDRERADSYELLATAAYFNSIKRDGRFTIMCKVNDTHNLAYEYLCKAMSLRCSHNPHLWKFSNQERVEGLLYRVETQTMEELSAIRNHGEGLMVELILARQRILDPAAYGDYLLPFITEYFLYLKKHRHFRQAISLLTHSLRLQLKLSHRKFEHTIIFLLGMVRSYRVIAEKEVIPEDENMSNILEAIMAFMEECYQCDISEKRFLLRWLYLTLLHLLYLCLLNRQISSDRHVIKDLTARFLRTTKDLKDSVLSTYEHCDEPYLFGLWTREPYRAVAGDNALHVACRHIPSPEYSYRKVDNGSESTALALLLQILLDCHQDINARNCEGKTPLMVLLDRHAPSTTVPIREAVRTLLTAGADPNAKDKLEQTALHSVISGYLSPRSIVSSDNELHEVLKMLLKSGADPNSMDKRGFAPLHVLLHQSSIQTDRQSFAHVVRTLQDFGGLVHFVAKDGRTVLDMCEDEELKEELVRRISASQSNWMRLSRLAAKTIRTARVPYRESMPEVLVHVIELRH